METLVIDEVSMLRADLLDAIDYSLRLNTGTDLPFGGKQVVFIGDVFQLPPVAKRNDSMYSEEDAYENAYFFSARVFRECLPKIVQLRKIYRQHDEDFIYLLNRIRTGIVSQEDLDHLNQRVVEENHDEDLSITLTSVNAIADQVNLTRMMEIHALSFTFKASIDGDFPEHLYPVSSLLKLKEGAQVMMVKNDLKGRWVNGSIGKIESVSETEIKVRFADDAVHIIERAIWENKTYTWDKSTNSISFTCTVHLRNSRCD
jgi:ATP-dependent DNA helicase PIF1